MLPATHVALARCLTSLSPSCIIFKAERFTVAGLSEEEMRFYMCVRVQSSQYATVDLWSFLLREGGGSQTCRIEWARNKVGMTAQQRGPDLAHHCSTAGLTRAPSPLALGGG